MANNHDMQQCPLCDSDASYDLCDNGNIKYFHCNICSDFFIGRSASVWINKNEPHRKKHFSKVAASCKGKEKILSLTIKVGEGLYPDTVFRSKYPII